MNDLPTITTQLTEAIVEEAIRNYQDWYSWEEGNSFTSPYGRIECIAQEDAGEGDYSADIHLIFCLTIDDDRFYFRKNGHYESYEGTTWHDGLKRVYPREKVVLAYE